jgi:hypothetical protein
LTVGARKRALLVSEQFALEQILVQRGTVHWNERLRFTRTVKVDGSGDQFFACAAFSADQH